MKTRRSIRQWLITAWSFCAFCASGCGSAGEFSGPLPTPDGQRFVSEVYPLLLRDCAFVACHGGPERFLQVYGPGRVRLDPSTTKPNDPATLPEVLHSYERARSMIATADRPERSMLLGKPLEPEAGGQGHKGIDDFGRNVFGSTRDPGYVLLASWARSQGAPPTAAQLQVASDAAMTEAAP